MNPLQPAFLHVNLCTYADLRERGQAIVGFVEMALALADAAHIPLRISLERERSRRPKTGRKLTASVWRQLRQAVLDGEYAYVFVFNDSADGRPGSSLPDSVVSFSLAVRAGDPLTEAAAWVRDAHAQELLLKAARSSPRFVNLAIAVRDGQVHSEQKQTVQVAGDTFAQLDGACGFINLDDFQFISGDLTSHELSRRVYWATTPGIYQTHLRGAFWGNLLSPRHVDLLGGYAQVAREAPCQVIESLRFDDPAVPGAYLQLTPDLSRVTDTRTNALARYLAPVLL